MTPVAGFDHILKSYDTADLLDDIASSDPPAYLRRCFAEGSAAPFLSWARVQQLAACAMVVDAVVNARDYAGFEPELIADWRVHYAGAFARLREPACAALRRSVARNAAVIAADAEPAPPATDPGAPGGEHPSAASEVEAELRELERRLESS